MALGFLSAPAIPRDLPYSKAGETHRCFLCACETPITSPPKRPRSHYSDRNVLHRELLDFTDGTPRMPTSVELRKANCRHLENAITRHGGFLKVANALGLERKGRKNGKAYERWSLERVEREVLGYVSQYGEEGRMPTKRQLIEKEMNALAFAIERFEGFENVAEKLGLVRTGGKMKGWWKDWGRLETELRLFLEDRSLGDDDDRLDNGVEKSVLMPSQKELRDAGRADLAEAIQNMGGLDVVARRMNITSRSKRKDYWRQFRNLAYELYSFNENSKRLRSNAMPSQDELRKAKRSDIVQGIYLHGGTSRVAERLGLTYQVRTNERFRNWNVFRRFMLGFIERHGTPGTLPTERQLLNFNHHELYKAVLHHGGFGVVADRMGLRTVKFLNDFPTVGKSVLDFIHSHGTPGEMPTEQEFKNIGRNTLNVTVAKFGYSQVARRLGLRERIEPQQQALDTIVSSTINEYDDEDLLPEVADAHIQLSDLM